MANVNVARIPQSLFAATLVTVEADTKADTEGNDNDDDDNNQEAPPLEPTGTAGMLIRLLDFLVAMLNVVDSLNSILFGLLNDRVLLFNHDSQLLVQCGKFGKSLFNAL